MYIYIYIYIYTYVCIYILTYLSISSFVDLHTYVEKRQRENERETVKLTELQSQA